MRLKLILLSFCALAACAGADERRCGTPPAGLEKFHTALAEVEAGKRAHPLSILYLGDSHIARDDLTGEMRSRWEAIFGPSARLLAPGIPYRYYAPQGFEALMQGPWMIASSLRPNDPGPYGLQGFRVSASAREALMSLALAPEKKADEMLLQLVARPGGGGMLVTLGDAPPMQIETSAEKQRLMQIRLPLNGARKLTLQPAGNGEVMLLGWSLAPSEAKLRFDAYGIVSARASITDRWDEGLLAAQLKSLNPDLIILGYGTNEGFDPGASPAALAQHMTQLIGRLRSMAPQASIALLGAFDGAKRTGVKEAQACVAADGDASHAGWITPPRLDQSRAALMAAASQAGAFTWDGSRVMGRPCGIHKWALAEPALAFKDHVHLKAVGARRAGAALWQALMGQYGTPACRVVNQ